MAFAVFGVFVLVRPLPVVIDVFFPGLGLGLFLSLPSVWCREMLCRVLLFLCWLSHGAGFFVVPAPRVALFGFAFVGCLAFVTPGRLVALVLVSSDLHRFSAICVIVVRFCPLVCLRWAFGRAFELVLRFFCLGVGVGACSLVVCGGLGSFVASHSEMCSSRRGWVMFVVHLPFGSYFPSVSLSSLGLGPSSARSYVCGVALVGSGDAFALSFPCFVWVWCFLPYCRCVARLVF